MPARMKTVAGDLGAGCISTPSLVWFLAARMASRVLSMALALALALIAAQVSD